MGERRPQHYGVGAAGKGFTNISAGAEPAIGDDGNVTAGAAEVVFPGCGTFQGCRDLGDPYTHHFASGAGGAGPHAHQDSVDAGFHKLLGHFVGHAVPHYNRDPQGINQVGKNESLVAPGHVPGGGDGGLDHHHVGPCLDGYRGHALGILGGERHRAYRAGAFYLLDPPADEVFLDGLGVNVLKVIGCLVLRHGDYFFQGRVGVFVPGI